MKTGYVTLQAFNGHLDVFKAYMQTFIFMISLWSLVAIILVSIKIYMLKDDKKFIFSSLIDLIKYTTLFILSGYTTMITSATYNGIDLNIIKFLIIFIPTIIAIMITILYDRTSKTKIDENIITKNVNTEKIANEDIKTIKEEK